MIMKRFLGIAVGLIFLVSPAYADVRTSAQIEPMFGQTYKHNLFIPIPTNNSIQADLISFFPRGLFKAWNVLATPFAIVPTSDTCGPMGGSQCNFYDGFGFNGAGKKIVISVRIPAVKRIYTLMNAYAPQPVGLATIEFLGDGGAHAEYQLIGGEDIRDFYQGAYQNTLHNRAPKVFAIEAFHCNDPGNCLGAAGTGDVTTGYQGNYNIDEQVYFLPPTFQSQNLVRIIITDTYNGSNPILLGMTAGL